MSNEHLVKRELGDRQFGKYYSRDKNHIPLIG